jgi:hypothetical protein
VIDAGQYQGSAAVRIAGNMLRTLVPAFLRNPEGFGMFHQNNQWGDLRDQFFAIFQTNLIFALGLVGGPFALWLLYRAFRAGAGGREPFFWALFIPAIFVMGIAVVGEVDIMGLTHLTLLPLVALGVTLVAAAFPWRRAMAALLMTGCAAGFLLGIFLQLRVENLDNSAQRTIFPHPRLQDHVFRVGTPPPDSLNPTAWGNWFIKNRDLVYLDGIRELETEPTPQNLAVIAKYHVDIGQNSYNFGGWYGRHGGHVTFLGDDLAGPSFADLDIPSVVMLLLFAGLMSALWRESMRFAAVAAALSPTAAAAPVSSPRAAPLRKKAAKRR